VVLKDKEFPAVNAALKLELLINENNYLFEQGPIPTFPKGRLRTIPTYLRILIVLKNGDYEIFYA
jgi:hypothetical protein